MDVEFIPIAIPLNDYELHVANLIEILLQIEDKLNSTNTVCLKSEAA